MSNINSDAMRSLGVVPRFQKHFSQMQVREQLTVEQGGILAQRTVTSAGSTPPDVPFVLEFLVGFAGNVGQVEVDGDVTIAEGVTNVYITSGTRTLTLPNGKVDGQLVWFQNRTATNTAIDHKKIGFLQNDPQTVTIPGALERALMMWYTDTQDSGWLKIA